MNTFMDAVSRNPSSKQWNEWYRERFTKFYTIMAACNAASWIFDAMFLLVIFQLLLQLIKHF